MTQSKERHGLSGDVTARATPYRGIFSRTLLQGVSHSLSVADRTRICDNVNDQSDSVSKLEELADLSDTFMIYAIDN